ncbi:MAG: helix-turn-helix domain-containing protein [Verrucomicrobiota bacterium]
MTTENQKLKQIPFAVHIPNLDGDGIAQTVTIEVTAYADPETGEDILTPESLDLIEKTQARHLGLISAGELKALRQRLGLSQDEMSDLLQIGGKSYTRWESGRARPSRSLNVLLCALRDGQIDVNYLQSLRHPDRPAAWTARDPYQQMLETWLAQGAKTQIQTMWNLAARAIKSEWKHLTPPQNSAPAGPVKKPGPPTAQAAPCHSDEDEPAMPCAPRLPTTIEQRRAFMQSGIDTTTPEPIFG